MSYSLLRDSRVVIHFNGEWYFFDAISDLTFSQTFDRVTNNRKTLHSKNSRPLALVGSKNTANVSMDILCTNSGAETVFLEMVGMIKVAPSTYSYPAGLGTVPPVCDIYIVNKTSSILFRTAVVESIDIVLDKTSPMSFNIAFSASDMVDGVFLPNIGAHHKQGSPLKLSPIYYKVGGTVMNGIVSAGINIQQTVSWRKDKGIHDIGNLYTYSVPILEDLTFGMTAACYHEADGDKAYVDTDPIYTSILLSKSGFNINLQPVLFTKRLTAGTVYMGNHDITITEQTQIATVEYGGALYEKS